MPVKGLQGRVMILISFLFALAATDAAEDPLGPARAGQLQCHTPDIARKTCQALAGYTFAADGTILNQAEVVLNASPLIVMWNESTVNVRDGAICGQLADFDKTRFTVEGGTADPAMADQIKAQVVGAYAALGREGCTRYTGSGNALTAEVSIDGLARPEFNQPVIWVSRADGYAVRP